MKHFSNKTWFLPSRLEEVPSWLQGLQSSGTGGPAAQPFVKGSSHPLLSSCECTQFPGDRDIVKSSVYSPSLCIFYRWLNRTYPFTVKDHLWVTCTSENLSPPIDQLKCLLFLKSKPAFPHFLYKKQGVSIWARVSNMKSGFISSSYCLLSLC